TMSPYEVTYRGGSIEHWNEEPGALWLSRVTSTFRSCVWLNPTPADRWNYSPSIGLIFEAFGGRMYPLTLAGLDEAMRELGRYRLTGSPLRPLLDALGRIRLRRRVARRKAVVERVVEVLVRRARLRLGFGRAWRLLRCLGHIGSPVEFWLNLRAA